MAELHSVPRVCRGCGCTADNACVTAAGACFWVADDLCSACAANGEQLPDEEEMADTGACPASAVPAPHQPLWLDQDVCYCVRCRQRFAA